MKITFAAIASLLAGWVLAGCGSTAQPAAPNSAVASAGMSRSPTAVAQASPVAGRTAAPPAGWGARPPRRVTPGSAGTGLAAICPSVSQALANSRPSKAAKDQVFAEYGIPASQRYLYRIDYLVPVELDGRNSLRNLWPQPAEASRAKNRLENTLHHMVCSGEISLHQAQKAIETNWVRAYHRYVASEAAPISAAPTMAPPAAPSSTGCYPLTNGGNCYEPGEFCRTSDHGMTGRAGDGEAIICEDNNGWRWEPA